MENSKRSTTRFVTEAGIMLALTFILNTFKLMELPQGGSITLGGYVPLLIFGFRWGWKKGIVLGALYGLLDFALDPFFLNPLQFILDYPLAYAMLGLTGLFSNKLENNGKVNYAVLILGTVVATLLRMLSAVISGVVYFSEYLPKDKPFFIGSLIYNGTYTIPNMIIAIILIIIIYPRVKDRL
ncbi:energy-coupled thiamine transporter ThiT [Lagierella sp.]|uniref:energy-coupled thiamine transporter ThiT n=1 Tax=Lagierella sp. TaxID=2849657 RepID=UPI0026188EEF|nr:energy-coupled thiamine transporter ThiT [Lagierella sp.]